MNTFRQSEVDDPPSCLDAAYERQAIMNGSAIFKATFPENEKYLPKTGDCGWHMDKREAKQMLEDCTQKTDGNTTNTFGSVNAKGLKYDNGKPDYSLLPSESIEETVRVFTMGAAKYGRNNWQRGLDWSRVFAACMRHLWAWWRGEEKDPESGLSHLHHAACNIMMLQYYEKTGMTQWDDR